MACRRRRRQSSAFLEAWRRGDHMLRWEGRNLTVSGQVKGNARPRDQFVLNRDRGCPSDEMIGFRLVPAGS